MNLSLQKKLILFAAATAISMMAGTSNAQAASLNRFVIDSFEQPLSPLQYLEVNKQKSRSYSQAYGSNEILGGYRDMDLTRAGSISGSKRALAEVSDGILTWSNDSAVKSKLQVTWDGNDSPSSLKKNGLGGLDLTANSLLDGIWIEVVSDDLDSLSIALDIYDMSGKKYSTSSVGKTLIQKKDEQGYFFSFAEDFKIGTSTTLATKDNFSKVGSVQMTLNGLASTDAEIKLIEARSNKLEVPEPNLSWLALAGVAGLAILGKSQAKSQ
jgi:hypothetical protein